MTNKVTDEEIEKALDRCKSEDLPCQECAYWHIATQGYNCRNALIRDVANYINRLKAENERLMKAHINELELLTFEMKNGEIDMKFGGEFCDAFVYSIVQMFKQNYGKNFVTATFEMDDRETSDRYA